MKGINIYLKDGTLFANGYNRIVHGGRGDYVEFDEEHILLPLISKFNNDISKDDLDIYYWQLYPEGHPDTKVYLQRKIVKYTNYKIGKFYVSPYLFKDFKDPEQLFSYD